MAGETGCLSINLGEARRLSSDVIGPSETHRLSSNVIGLGEARRLSLDVISRDVILC